MLNDNNKGTQVQNYNQDAEEMMDQVLTGVTQWQHQTPRVNLSNLLANAANDNNKTQAA